MAKIFLNYRREETSGHAGRLYDRLSQHFGADQIFMDLDTLKPGVDFTQDIDQAVGQCEVMVSLVGNRWLVLPDESGGPRINNPEDWVRLEIKSALDRNIPVVPVLVQRASMPSKSQLPSNLEQFTRRQAFELLDNRFHQDADNLIDRLEEILQEIAEQKRLKDEAKQREAEHQRREKEEKQKEEAHKREMADLEPRLILFKFLTPIHKNLILPRVQYSILIPGMVGLGMLTFLISFDDDKWRFYPDFKIIYLGGAVFLVGLYIWFHHRLKAFWEQINSLRGVFSDWKFFEENATSFLLRELIWSHFPLPKDHSRRFSRVRAALQIFFLWYGVPLTLLTFWFTDLIRHYWPVTALHIVGFGLSVWVSLKYYGIAKNNLPSRGLSQSSRGRYFQFGIEYKHYVVLGLMGILVGFSWVAFHVPHMWPANLENESLRRNDFSQTNLMGANLKEADLKGVNLQEANLRSANLKGAVFGPSIWDGALTNLTGANLLDVKNLTQTQLDAACSDGGTQLPPGFKPPRLCSKEKDESPEDQSAGKQ